MSWLEYAVLKVEFTAPVKGRTVFVGSLAVIIVVVHHVSDTARLDIRVHVT